MHCLKDTGAQCTLILSDFAKARKFQVIGDVDIKINGFNSSKPYNTKIVNVPLQIGADTKYVRAVCVPDINIELKIIGLNDLVTQCVSSGLTLADKTILDYNEGEVINNIHMILGADYSYLLSETEYLFDPPFLCNCYNTKLGVILMGDVKNISANLTKLVSSHGTKRQHGGRRPHSLGAGPNATRAIATDVVTTTEPFCLHGTDSVASSVETAAQHPTPDRGSSATLAATSDALYPPAEGGGCPVSAQTAP